MGKRVAAILVIFVCSTLAWVVLGGTIMTRTYSLDGSLQQKVASTWGSPQTQRPPAASFIVTSYKEAESLEDGKKVVRKVEVKEEKLLSLDASRVDVQLDLEPRKKGLLWYSTYKVVFDAKYTFAPMASPEEVTIRIPFPAAQALYDDLAVKVDGVPIEVTSEPASAPAGRARRWLRSAGRRWRFRGNLSSSMCATGRRASTPGGTTLAAGPRRVSRRCATSS